MWFHTGISRRRFVRWLATDQQAQQHTTKHASHCAQATQFRRVRNLRGASSPYFAPQSMLNGNVKSRSILFFFRGIALALLVATVAKPSRAADSGNTKPHIIFVLADDSSAGDVGCYGGTIARTPNIDRLAREGVRFTHFYSASPICSPSRAGLITGQCPARCRITSYLQTRAGNQACEQADYLDPKATSL